MSPKITGFIISIILISLIASGMGIMISGVSNSYSVNYDNESLESFNQIEDISENAQEIKEATDMEVDPNFIDVIGGYLKSGYNALQITTKSFSLFDTMLDDAIDKSTINNENEYFNSSFANTLKVALTSIVIVLVFVGIIISIMIKRERL